MKGVKLDPENMPMGLLRRCPPNDIYILGGGYCARCHVAYSFMELYMLLQEQRKTRTTHMPACKYCKGQVRIKPRNTPRPEKSVFWSWVDILENNGKTMVSPPAPRCTRQDETRHRRTNQ